MKKIRLWLAENLIIAELTIVAIIIFIGATVFHFVEGWSYFDSLYYIIITMATIGYGDFVPATTLGKIFAMIFAFMGVPLFISISGLALEARFNRRIKRYMYNIHREMKETEEKLLEKEQHTKKELHDDLRHHKPRRKWWKK